MSWRIGSRGPMVSKIQQRLVDLGWELEVDGVFGPDTEACVAGFQEEQGLDPDGWVGEKTYNALFASKIESQVPGDNDYNYATKEGTIKAIISECTKRGFNKAQIAYVLATVYWETGKTFQPVREMPKATEVQRRVRLSRYYPYYGRGYVQITWKRNYDKFAKLLNIDLVDNPDLALQPNISLFILMEGFDKGLFTGKSIHNYIVSEDDYDFYNARRCINGVDRATEIAEIAEEYLENL